MAPKLCVGLLAPLRETVPNTPDSPGHTGIAPIPLAGRRQSSIIDNHYQRKATSCVLPFTFRRKRL